MCCFPSDNNGGDDGGESDYGDDGETKVIMEMVMTYEGDDYGGNGEINENEDIILWGIKYLICKL